jgi:hypothetical protein
MNSMWNGKFGADEMERRNGYGRSGDSFQGGSQWEASGSPGFKQSGLTRQAPSPIHMAEAIKPTS